MADKFQNITELYESTAKAATATPSSWRAFLTFACRNYRLPFDEQLLIYAQRPDATAVLELDRWNQRFGRWVNRGAKGIAVFDREHPNRLRYYFDVADTHETRMSRPVPLWQVRSEYEQDVVETLENCFGELEHQEDLGDALLSAVRNAVEDNMGDYLGELEQLTQDSLLEGLDSDNLTLQFRTVLGNSVAAMLLARCGIDTASYLEDEDFQDVGNFNTPETRNALGVATRDIARMCLDEIARTVLSLERQGQKENRTLADSPTNLYAETREPETPPERSPHDGSDLHHAGELPASQSAAVPGEANAPGQVRPDAEALFAGAPENHLHQPVDQREAFQPSGRNSADGTAPDRGNRSADGESSGRDGGTESQRPDEMGADDEQPAERSGGNGAGGTDLQLTQGPQQLSLFPSEQEQIRRIDQVESEQTLSAFSVSQESIDHVLRLGGNTDRNRERVAVLYEEQKPLAEIVASLPSLYHGGDGIGSVTAWYDQDGIHLSQGQSARYDSAQVIPWQTAAERIGQLLENGQFATNVELAEAGSYERSLLADRFWYLYHDLSVEAMEAGYLQSLSSIQGNGFPEESAWLTQQLADPAFRAALLDEYQQFLTAHQENRGLLRFHYHRLEEMLRNLRDLDLPRKTFSTGMPEVPEVRQFITEDEIDAALAAGPYMAGGKGRIYAFFQGNHTSQEKAGFLKQEYGIGGRSHALSGNGKSWENSDGQGLVYRKENCLDVRLSWTHVARHIDHLVEQGRYLSPQELDEWEKDQAEKELAQADEIASANTEEHAPSKVYDLGYGHLGNGVTVWNRLEEEHGDYKTVAHIAPDRTVQIYDEEMPQAVREEIQRIAGTSEMTVSATQNAPVFAVPPKVQEPPRKEEVAEGSYQLLSRLKADCDYFLGAGGRAEKHLWTGNVDGQIAKMWELYAALPEKPEWLTMEDIDRYAQRMEPFYEVVVYHHFENGFDERMDYQTLDEAERVAQKYVAGTMEGEDGFAYDGAGVYDLQENRWLRVYGNFPDERAIAEASRVLPDDRQEKTGPVQMSIEDPAPYEDLVGKELTIDGHRFVVERVSDLTGDVALRDVTFEESHGFPLDRMEKIDQVRQLIVEQEEPVKQRSTVIDLTAPVREEEASTQKEELPTPPSARRARVSPTVLHPEIPPEQRRNFRITDGHLGEGGAKTKFHNNVAAIQTLRKIESEGRLATPEEQEILSRYVGWGGLPQVFDGENPQWAEEFAALKGLLSPEEYDAAKATTLNAHYTSPTVIKAIYQAVENMGFRTGNILEPSCGIGNFFGLVPESMKDSHLYGVELDPLTGRIAQQLYQQNSIAVQGFENTELPDSFFDLAIGNVPFGSYSLHDKRYDKHHFLIHDYFFAKTLDKVRPGGIVAFITSKGTMDKQNPSVRKYLAERAQLIGAIRLPNNAFLANAGTRVTTDILFLQKREKLVDVSMPAPDSGLEWLHLVQTEDGVPINQYFLEHPEMMLGQMAFDRSMYGNAKETTCKPLEGESLSDLLAKAVGNLHAQYTPYEIEEREDEEDRSIPADPTVRNFSYTVVDGVIYYREDSRMFPVEVSVTAENRIRGMIALRDCARSLIEVQMEDGSEEAVQAGQQELNRLYDSFTAQYGLLNSRANTSVFSSDSSFPLLCSLEILDEQGNLKRKADLFTKRTIQPYRAVTHVDTAPEALAVSLGEKARVDLEYMGSLTGKTQEQLAEELRGVIFPVPGEVETDGKPHYVTADEYLSGNVREKLKTARQAAEQNPSFAVNVQALEKVQPKDLTAGEISVRLGAAWIPEDVAEQFTHELLQTPFYYKSRIRVQYSPVTGEWNVSEKSLDRSNIRVSSTYGTKRVSAYKIIEDKKSLEAKLKKLNDQSAKDDVVTFEELGVDRLFIDEADLFKNLYLYTKMRNVGGISQTESQKASDLYMKCQYMDERTGGKGVVFATGTPVSNSMAELYTRERLRILHDFYRTGEEDAFHFDMNQSARLGHSFKDAICPDSVERFSDHLKLGDKYCRVLYLKEYANYIKDEMVNELTDFNRNLMLSIDILPVPTDEAVREVENRLLGVETNITNWQRRQNQNNNFSAVIPYDMELQRKESKEFLNDLTTRDQRMMLCVLTLVIMADSYQQLQSDTESIQAVARKQMCQMAVLKFQQMDGLNTALPIGVRKINAFRTLTTESLAVFMPFKVQEIQDKGGIYFGENAISHNLLLCNKGNLLNQSAFQLGVPGSGKSFLSKEQIAFLILNTEDDVLICDPENEFGPLCQTLGREDTTVIHMAAGGKDRLNAMYMVEGYGEQNPIVEKSQFVMSLIEQIDRRGVGPHHKSIIDRCTALVYQDAERTGKPATLCGLREKLLEQPEEKAKDIALSLELFTTGSLDIFGKESTVDLDKRIVVFDIHSLGEQLKPTGLLVITDTILNRVTLNWKRGKRTHVFIDEFHVVFENEQSGIFFNSAWRQFRKRGAYPTAITQNVEYLLDSVQASTMLSNSEFIVMLNQAASDREKLSKLLNISKEQMSYVTNADAGCGLLRYGSALVPFVNRFPKDTKLYALMTTKPGEGVFGGAHG